MLSSLSLIIDTTLTFDNLPALIKTQSSEIFTITWSSRETSGISDYTAKINSSVVRSNH